MIAVAALAWVVLLGVLTLMESRRHDRRVGELERLLAELRDPTVLGLQIHASRTAGDIASLRAEVAELRCQTHTHPRFNHEPAVGRLLAGEPDASARRGTENLA